MSRQAVLRKLIEAAGGGAGDGYVLALKSEGLHDLPSEIRTSGATYSVHWPSTELGLRRLLMKANGAPFVAVIERDLAKRLPPDLIRRAQGRRVTSLSLSEVLGVLLGVRVQTNDDAARERLALEHLDDLHRELKQRTLPTVIDPGLLDELLLEVTVGRRMREVRPGQLLADWLRQPPDWSEEIEDLVRASLPSLQGVEGRILSWGLKPQTRLTQLLVRGALLALDEPEVPQALWGGLWELTTDRDVGLPLRELRRLVSTLAEETLDALGADADPWLTMAETIAVQLLAPSVLQRHHLLPMGLRDRAAVIAKTAAGGVAIEAGEIAALKRHRAADSQRAPIAVLSEVARLSRWLAHRTWLAERTESNEASDPVTLARSYRDDGAFADMAALRLQRHLAATVEHHDVARTLLSRYRAARDEDNLRFATGLADDYVASLHAPGVCPVHRVWPRLVLPAEGEEGTSGVFVVVLDGCSYPVFLELLYELTQDPVRTVGLRFRAKEDAPDPVGLAILPTVTSHSRGALFLGEIPDDPLITETVWRDQKEGSSDPTRLKRNQTLGERTRRLFLKGDLVDGGRALVDAVKGDDIEIVAAVFNAVDDQIGSHNTGQVVGMEPAAIKGFLPAIHAALFQRGTPRRVLVTADHGHTPFVSKELCRGAGTGARFVEMGTGDVAPEGFVEIDVGGLGGGQGAKAFAWQMGAYRGRPHVGYHGGCGLEEMVVPMAWLVPHGVMQQEPAWWFGDARAGATPAEVPRANASTGRVPGGRPTAEIEPERKPVNQLALFDGAPSRAARAAQIGRLALPDAVVAALDETDRAALVVLSENREARATQLAQAIGKAPGRISGFMTRLNRRLHRLGIDCIQVQQGPGGEPLFQYTGDPPSEA